MILRTILTEFDFVEGALKFDRFDSEFDFHSRRVENEGYFDRFVSEFDFCCRSETEDNFDKLVSVFDFCST